MPTKFFTNIKNSLPDDSNRGFFYHLLKWLLIASIIFMLLLLISKPLRKVWSNNYIRSGDEYLLQKKFLSAELEYEKAQNLYSLNTKARDREILAMSAATDVRNLQPFYQEKNLGLQIENIKLATEVPSSEFEAAKNAKYLIEQSEYQLAILAATTATEMNSKYRDGWLYLAIANMKTAEFTELSKADRAQYVSAAQSSILTALELDPEYEPTRQYQDEISKL
jgi:hypothetical protein